SPVSVAQLGSMLDLLGSGEISGKMGKDLFEILWAEGGDPAEIAARNGMKQVTDTGEIEAAIDALMAANPDQVEKARANPRLAGWFTGQVLKATGGKANPAVVGQMVAAKLAL
ncbi:MAG: Asp-tRNA(Asn)/Glu-tRNA(Gln) amidotransferase GatCAB subunit B, partial [Pseudorhodobacter sp.]|nr:Asp-tRNA(Asn)/Glu-tRNA(Gln) amidotransferase GatCAB subunit B [Pseudorhodobacter sp.]